MDGDTLVPSIVTLLYQVGVGGVAASTTQTCLETAFVHELILDQNEGFHRVLKGQLVLAHLRKNSADVQMDVARV